MAGTSPNFISVRNLERYQHYKTRRPPWVKLYASILDDPDLAALPEATRWLAVGLIILASSQDNRLPIGNGWIRNRLSMTVDPDLESLKDIGFICNWRASMTLAPRKQNALSETETETETETEGKASASSEASTKRTTPDRSELSGFARAWKAFPHYGQRSRKELARKVWIKRDLEAQAENVLRWIETGSPDWKREAGRFVPGMQVWLAGPDFSEDTPTGQLSAGLDQERLDMYRNLGRKS